MPFKWHNNETGVDDFGKLFGTEAVHERDDLNGLTEIIFLRNAGVSYKAAKAAGSCTRARHRIRV